MDPITGDLPCFGNHGYFLRVDLSSRRADRVPLSARFLREYLGGSGLGTALLLRERAAAEDPLNPAAPLVFAFSALVGSPLTTSAKFAVVSKSPLTGRINDSLVSSGFAIAGKKCAGDAILIVGRAAELSVLILDDGQMRLESAADLCGLPCDETEKRLLERLSPGFRCAVIGPAGERLVRYATISHDGRHAGRGGSGAVLGSKNIKAIAVRGTRRPEWFDPSGLTALSKELSHRSFGPATAKYRELGTASNLLLFNRLKTLPTRNFQMGSFAEAEALAPETLADSRSRTQASCAACTIGCEHIYAIRPSLDPAEKGVRLEYENLFALGPLCGVSDPQIVLTASQRCDELGIDTISTGGTIAFAMECVERGWLEAPWLKFGDGESLLKAIGLIGQREGLGDQLADGSRILAGRLGPESLSIAAQVKGLELPGYEPRALQTMALGFATGTRGADHNRSGAYEADFSERTDRRKMDDRSAQFAIESEDKAAIMDSLILCKFLRGVLSDFYQEGAKMLVLVTGWDVTADELRMTARRIIAAKKLFNIQAGWTPAEDTLPERFLTQSPQNDAASRLTVTQLAAGIRAYNSGRDWTADGWLPVETIERLGLSNFT